MLLFCGKAIVKKSCKFELARLKKKKKKKKKKILAVWRLSSSVLSCVTVEISKTLMRILEFSFLKYTLITVQ